MSIFSFFKNLFLKRKVRKTYNSFFAIEYDKLNTSYYMNEIPSSVLEIYNKIKNDSKYEKDIKLYDEYFLAKENHNKEISELSNIIDSFSLKSILNNPETIDYKDMLSKYEIVLQRISSFNKIGNKFKSFKKEYLDFKDNYTEILNQYKLKQALDILDSKCENMYIDEDDNLQLNNEYQRIKDSIIKGKKLYYEFDLPLALKDIEKHNKEFIFKHEDDPIFDDVNGRSLDREQRKAVLCNAKSNLTIAGAGSGKTLTICGKVKYLLDELRVDASDILLLSYSKKSADDLQAKVSLINNSIKVGTFHALGLDILKQATGKAFTVDDSFNAVIEKYFREELQKDITKQERVLRYYGLYLTNLSNKKYENKGDLYEDVKKSDFKTLKDQLQGYNQAFNKLETIKKENVKSFEELAIANWLFINGINYEYESTYKWEDTATNDKRQYTPDFYLPDYDLYYEHYGLNENGEASQYSKEEAEEYVQSVEWKRQLHSKNKTTCIETFSYEFANGTIFNKLEAIFEAFGIEKKPLDNKAINNAINSIYDGIAFKSFINLIRSFISLYKARYENENMFDVFKDEDYKTEYEYNRRKLFLGICKDIYLYYVRHLEEEKKIDYDDMILKSMNALDGLEQFNYKYIIVDEFQDISYSRMLFLKKLIAHGHAKLFAVGDDWQAIYRFSGCDISIFTKIEDYFQGVKTNLISSTHRNSQELQNIAEPFITANPEQFKKNVHSNKSLDNPVQIMYYNDNKFGSFIKILEDISNKDKHANVLLLGRNNKDIESIESDTFYRASRLSDKYISKDFPSLNISFITVHASKGLEADYVVIINADDAKMGFPNKIEDDNILNLVLSEKSEYEYAEERRLWYVALTRTRTYTYILASHNNPSEFVREIEKKCFIMNEADYAKEASPILCPNCKTGHLIIRENKENGSRFYGCSNYPYCNYTNNDIKLVNTNHRCKLCGDFMVFRKGPYGAFWGCRNYPRCKYKEEYVPKK